jgi:Secretion system C-terminal sorting domain/FG-GAP-like repeat
MKKIFLFLLPFIFSINSMYAGNYAVRISIDNKSKLSSLSKFITRFEDVKVTSKGKFIYNEENDFVTAICNESQLGRLTASGFVIDKVEKYIEPAEQDILPPDLPYQFGWPRQSSNDWPFYNSSTTIADMNGDGLLEIGITHSFSTVNPILYVYKFNGAYVIGFPYVIPFGTLQNSGSWEIPAMGDIDGDGQLEIVHADENGNIYAHKYDGSMVTGFPYNTGGTNEHSVPALQDVNNDGKAEIIITSYDRNNDLNAQLHVFNYTGSTLAEIQGFPINYPKGSVSSPVVADVDHDGNYEIFVGTGYDASSSYTGRILCYMANGNPKPGWPVMVGNYAVGSPGTLVDINNDNKLDFLIRVQISGVNGIYAFDFAGNIISPFPFVVPSGHPNANVCVGDVDNDGQLEVGFGSVEAVDLGKVFVWKLNGSLLPGYPQPVNATWVDGSTAMADVSGDGVVDIIAPTNLGKIYAFNMNGALVTGFPLSSQATILNGFETSPTMVDIDHDGDVELFAPCHDRKIYCWDTPGIYDSSKIWSTYKGNPARTGTKFADYQVGVKNIGSSLPSKFYLYQNYPNPFNPVTKIKFDVPTSNLTLSGAKGYYVKLTIYDILGREAAILVNKQLAPGTYEEEFNGTSLPSGIYFYRLYAGNIIQTKKMALIK